MTKRDFELIANALKKVHDESDYITTHEGYTVWRNTIDMFAAALVRANPRFDRDRFLDACGV